MNKENVKGTDDKGIDDKGTNNKVDNLFIIVHPDDESIGCGALINKFYNEGNKNIIAVMSIQKFNSLRNGEEVTKSSRVDDLKKSLSILNGSSDYIEFCDTSLSCLDEYNIVGFIDRITKEYNPKRIFIPWKSFHHDHRITHECCLASSRIGNHNKSVQEYYFYDYPFYQFDNNIYGKIYIELTEDEVEAAVKSCLIYSNILDTNTLFSPYGVKHRYESIGYEIGKEFATKVVLFKSVNYRNY